MFIFFVKGVDPGLYQVRQIALFVVNRYSGIRTISQKMTRVPPTMMPAQAIDELRHIVAAMNVLNKRVKATIQPLIS